MRIHTGRTESWYLEKLTDDKFNGNHPNGYNEGITMLDITEYDTPTVGERPTFLSHDRWFVTSVTTEIVSEKEDETIFKTLNSTYRLAKKN